MSHVAEVAVVRAPQVVLVTFFLLKKLKWATKHDDYTPPHCGFSAACTCHDMFMFLLKLSNYLPTPVLPPPSGPVNLWLLWLHGYKMPAQIPMADSQLYMYLRCASPDVHLYTASLIFITSLYHGILPMPRSCYHKGQHLKPSTLYFNNINKFNNDILKTMLYL